ncbi:MAG: TlpA family protein disulfide reductase [Syntrophales bacterium]
MKHLCDRRAPGCTEHPRIDNGDVSERQPDQGQRSGRSGKGFSPRVKGIAMALAIACIFTIPSAIRAAKQKSVDITKPPVEEKAPDFVLTDLEGRQFRLSDHRGKRPVLLIFSTTWCTFCKAEIPHFKTLHGTYAKQGLEVVNIDIQESKEKVAKFAAQNQLPYRVLLDEAGTVSSVYEIRGVPTMILVDKNGMVACRQCRSVDSVLSAMMKE